MRWLLALLLLVGSATVAEAATFFAADDGSGSECSDASPCSFSTLLDTVQPGDTGILKPGSYSGGQTLPNRGGTAENPITIKAENPAVLCADPTNDPDGCEIDTASRSSQDTRISINGADTEHWTLEGFHMINSDINCDGSSASVGPSNITVRFMHFEATTTATPQTQVDVDFCSNVTIEHSYFFNPFKGSDGPDYAIHLIRSSPNVTVRNVYIAGEHHHGVSLKRAMRDVTIERVVCEGSRTECIFLGQNNDDSTPSDGEFCSDVQLDDGSTGDIRDQTSGPVTVRRMFARPSSQGGTDYLMPFALRINNVRDADIRDIFVANPTGSFSTGILNRLAPTGVAEGMCGTEPGNNVIRGATVVGTSGDQISCIRWNGLAHDPGSLTLQNFVCHNPDGGGDAGIDFGSSTSNSAWETTDHSVATIQNGVFNDCSSQFDGGQIESRVTDSHNNVFNCGSSRGSTGDLTVDPQFSGPESVPNATLDFSDGTKLWNWDGAGGWQEIIDQFDTGNANLVDAGTGTDDPCTGSACDIGANEFFAPVGAIWASAAIIRNIGPFSAGNGFDFNDNSPSDDTIVRNDGGSWLEDGFGSTGDISPQIVTDRVVIHDAGSATNDGTYEITAATASALTVEATGGGDAGLADASDDNTAMAGMPTHDESNISRPWIDERSGLAVDVDTAAERFVIGRCTDPLDEGTCDTDVYIHKSAVLQVGTSFQSVTLDAGTSGSDADTSGDCWRTRATLDFTETLEELSGLWVRYELDGDAGTHDCSATATPTFALQRVE